jgi:hypothetical protein
LRKPLSLRALITALKKHLRHSEKDAIQSTIRSSRGFELDDEIDLPPSLREQIERRLSGVNEMMSIDDILDLALYLKAVAAKAGYKELERFASELSEMCHAFDIETTQDMVRHFTRFFYKNQDNTLKT